MESFQTPQCLSTLITASNFPNKMGRISVFLLNTEKTLVVVESDQCQCPGSGSIEGGTLGSDRKDGGKVITDFVLQVKENPEDVRGCGCGAVCRGE